MTTTNATARKYRSATALDVKDGDIILNCGYRCRVSQVDHHESESGTTVARYTLHSAPDANYPMRLPGGFDGGRYGGNKLARVAIQVRDAEESTNDGSDRIDPFPVK